MSRDRTLSLILLMAGLLAAQEPLRVSVTFVQVDALVTDAKGRQVTDLTQDDFEVLRDGKVQQIKQFAYVRTGVGVQGARSGPAREGQKIQREDVSRTIAIVVDDLKMSFESAHFTREALKRFVEKQIEPGDLVAIITTTGGVGPLQQFTRDKKLLLAAVGRVRFNLQTGGRNSAVRALGPDSEESNSSIANLVQRRFAVGTMGTVKYVVEGMRDLPGRKSVVLFSDGFSIYSRGPKEPPVSADEARRVSDRANRSAVTIYSIDSRGLPPTNLQAADDANGMEMEQVREALDDRSVKFRDNMQGLAFLARETGGLAQFNSNDFNDGLRKMLEDQRGYYLLGFQVGEQDAARLNKEGKYYRLTVRVKRPGLMVRSRKGYMGEAGEEARPVQTPAARLLAALNSPFVGNGLNLRMTPTFVVGEKGQMAVQAMVHVQGEGLQLSEPGPDGLRSVRLRMVTTAEGDDAKSSGAVERLHVVRLKADEAVRVKADGLVYALHHEVRKPGAYQVRIAVLDETSGLVGAASRYLEVPDLSKGSLAISGITMRSGDWREQRSTDGDRSPAVRVFERGQPFSYGVNVYNARLEGRGVELRARLMRGDAVVWEAKPIAVVYQKGMDARRIPTGGMLTLGPKTDPGDYLLEVEAVQLDGKKGLATQWIDFEVR